MRHHNAHAEFSFSEPLEQVDSLVERSLSAYYHGLWKDGLRLLGFVRG